MGYYQVSTTNIEIELRSPTLVYLTKLAGTGKNLARIIVGMVSSCFVVVVCVLLCLIGSLVIMHVCVTHMLASLVV